MAKVNLPGIDDMRNRVSYSPETGEFVWMPRPDSDFSPTANEPREVRSRQWNSRCAGKPAFATTNKHGYRIGHFRAKLLLAHRVAFAIMEGRWPSIIDHINGNRSDNRWVNLREVSAAENLQNCAVRSDSRTGVTGVKPNARTGRGYISNIKVSGKMTHLGTFATKEEAIAARETAQRAHGFSPRHGKPR